MVIFFYCFKYFDNKKVELIPSKAFLPLASSEGHKNQQPLGKKKKYYNQVLCVQALPILSKYTTKFFKISVNFYFLKSNKEEIFQKYFFQKLHLTPSSTSFKFYKKDMEFLILKIFRFLSILTPKFEKK